MARAPDQSLFVPVRLNVLLVNRSVRTGQAFQRWQNDYANALEFLSPEPQAFDGNAAHDWHSDPGAEGAYLHWELPWGLRHAAQQDSAGSPDYPLVPNRWLVMRYNGKPGSRTATAWVIDSDFTDPHAGSVSFMKPFAAKPTPTKIGRATPISTWTEQGGELFLTAIGPGDASFAAFQPNVDNVFSFHDPLTGVPPQDTLSYMVAGWYSDPSRDVLTDLATGESLNARLAELGWDVLETGATPSRTICHGLAYGLDWDESGPAPASDRPTKPEQMTLAVGNTSIDAMTAIVANLPPVSGIDVDPEVLEAFQYGLLANYADPAVHGELWRDIHAAWFSKHPGGYTWRIVDANEDAALATGEEPGLDAKELEKEGRWLAALNRAQADLDKASADLIDMQRELYEIWWKDNRLPNLGTLPDGVTKAEFKNALDPADPNGLLTRTYKQLTKVARLRGSVPTGSTQEELANSIAAFARRMALPESRVLKRSGETDFFEPNNPVVVISGLNNAINSASDTNIWCRSIDELVAGFNYKHALIDVASMKGQIPSPDVSALPAGISALIEEFFFLDPTNATMVADIALGNPAEAVAVAAVMAKHQTVDGTLPDLEIMPLKAWTQPWQPRFLMWEVDWYPIAYDGTGGPNWEFDGEDYVWNGLGAETSRRTGLSGRIFLAPNIQFNLKSRISDYLKKHPDPPLKHIEDLLDAVEGWDLLSQSLDGFQQQLCQYQPNSNVAPFGSQVLYPPNVRFTDIVGDAPRYAPDPGVQNKPPLGPWPPSVFEGLRSGQFNFTRVMVVDAFGQTAEIVKTSTQQTFNPVKAPGMIPKHPVLPVAPERFVQLTPRIQQPTRLAADFVSNEDDKKILNLETGVNPVAAWVLPNHLDAGLSVFEANGLPIGEMRLAANALGQHEAIWVGAPNTPFGTLKQVAKHHPHVAAILAQFKQAGGAGEAEFKAFLAAIDESLWTIDPLGARDDQSVSTLIGRPLALLRARLKFELLGNPITDPTWRFTFNKRPADYVNSEFSISLGNASIQRDGLIGYFLHKDYATFYASNPPTSPPAYIQPIGPGTYIQESFADDTQDYVTLLVDPRAEVNIYSGVTATAQLELPQSIVNDALSAMAVTFSISPMLTDSINVESVGATTGEAELKIPMPLAATRAGAWSWLSLEGQHWIEQAVTSASQKPALSSEAPQLRSGMLKFSNGIATDPGAD